MRRGFEEIFWQTYLAQLDAKPGRCSLCTFQMLDRGGGVANALKEVCTSAKSALCDGSSHRTRVAGTWTVGPDYLDSAVRGKKRKELRRQRIACQKKAKCPCHATATAKGLAEWTDEFLVLEKRGWKGRNGSALACAQDTCLLSKPHCLEPQRRASLSDWT